MKIIFQKSKNKFQKLKQNVKINCHKEEKNQIEKFFALAHESHSPGEPQYSKMPLESPQCLCLLALVLWCRKNS